MPWQPALEREELAHLRVLELVGPSGSGKTSLSKALVEAGKPAARRVGLRSLASGPLLIKNLLLVAWPFLNQCRDMGPRRWNRLSMMVRLKTLGDLIDRMDSTRPGTVLLDQGPVYMLSILQRARQGTGQSFGPNVFEKYWNDTLSSWARRLDHVVVLEADDDTLYRRIRRRATNHKVRGMSKVEASDFFRRSRVSREAILADLQASSDPPMVLRLRTEKLDIRETARRLMDEVGSFRPGGGG